MRSFVAKLALVCGLALSACTDNPNVSSTTGGGAALTAATLSLSPSAGLTFDTVSIGATQVKEVSVVNTGQSPTSALTDASSGLGDFAYAGGAFPGSSGTCGAILAGGAGCTLAIAFSPTSASAQSATLILSFNGGSTATISLSGSGRDPMALATLAGVDKTTDFLGTTSTDQTGQSPTLHATKSAADDSITIIALADDPTAWLAVDALFAPNGTSLADLNDFDAAGNFTADELNRSYPAQGVQAVVIPQTPDIETQTPSGVYPFDIAAFDDNGAAIDGAVADVYVVHSGAGHRHVNVNLFFSGSAGLTAQSAQQDVDFQSVIAAFAAIWGQGPSDGCSAAIATTLGLCIDSINYVDLPSGYADIAGDATQTTPGNKDLEDLFMQSAAQSAGVNFFFIDDAAVDGLSSSSGLLGLDGSIPAPGALQGTPRSGAVVILDSVPSLPADVQELASTIAHEGGHYLGLYHDQESDCSADNLSDTPCDPSCVCQKKNDCDPAPGCAASQTDTQTNVMFWGADPHFAQTLFTDEQGATVARHPLVY